MRFHKKHKPKIPKHLAFDSDLAERSEEIAASENKSLNEWVAEAMRFRIETIDKASETKGTEGDQYQQSQTYVHGIKHLTINEADQIISDQIIPLIDKHDLVTIEDKDNFVSLSKTSKKLFEIVEVKLGKKRRIELQPVSHLDPFEKLRQEGLKYHRERRDMEERAQLMDALPIRVEEENKTDVIEVENAGIPVSTTTDLTDTPSASLATSSTLNTHLTYAEWLKVKREEEERDERLEKVKTEMRAQAKDSMKVFDESKEIPIDDDKDIQISPEDGDDGAYEDDSEKVPQEDI